jgi:hypothetical protein
MAAPTILQSGLFMNLILPFLLIFTVIFAILEKSEILGKGKKQVDALVALAVGLIVVAFGNYVDIIGKMTAFLGVAVVVILVFLILTAIFYPQGGFKLEDNVKKAGMGIAAVAVVIALLVYTGSWSYIKNAFSGNGSGLLMNVIFIVIIVAAVAAVVFGSKGGGNSGEEGKDK